MRHILSTIAQLPSRPILVTSGDKQQQLPFETVDNHTTTTENIFFSAGFLSGWEQFSLTIQQRVKDDDYQQMLNHLRYWPMTAALLKKLTQGRVLSCTSSPSFVQLFALLEQHPMLTVITVSRKSTEEVNNFIIQHLFHVYTIRICTNGYG